MTPPSAVVTIVHGRGDHLRAQQRSLTRRRPSDRPDRWVVVAMADPSLRAWHPAGLVPEVVDVAVEGSGLPLAAARNAGASRAIRDGAEVLIFLDVDCLAGPGLVESYTRRAAQTAGRVWCGPVTYLDPPPPAGYDLDRLVELDAPHPARPAPAPGEEVGDGDWDLFWSLSFALRADDFERVGGFCEDYVGYGGEDTDFGSSAQAAGLRLTWLGDARAYHQHHPVTHPPVEHAADIVRNARLFHQRWGRWPMLGWLRALADLGVVHHGGDGWQLTS